MRYSKAHQETTRRKLLEAAVRLMRSTGLRGATVDRIAEAAGLTHGAVYKHFASKQALVREAMSVAGAEFRERLAAAGGSPIELYLGPAHRDASDGCPVAVTAGDAALAGPAADDTFADEVLKLAHVLSPSGQPQGRPTDKALARAALAVGGLVLARGIADPALSDRLLAACASFARGGGADRGRAAATATGPRSTALDLLPRRRLDILGTEIAYIDAGSGPAMIFIHGTNTFSYAWRHLIPHFLATHRCLAPDLVGMGMSGPAVDGGYRYFDQVRHLDAWLQALDPGNDLVLVGHEWGATMCLDLAARHPERVKAVVHLGGLLGRGTLGMFPRPIAALHRQLRQPDGAFVVLEDNMLFEKVIRRSTLRRLSDAEIEIYGARWRGPEADRQPLLGLTRDLPLDGEPADVCRHLHAVSSALAASPIPKLHIRGVPGWRRLDPDLAVLDGWRNQHQIEVPGIHLLPEDSPGEIAAAITDFLDGADLMPRETAAHRRASSA